MFPSELFEIISHYFNIFAIADRKMIQMHVFKRNFCQTIHVLIFNRNFKVLHLEQWVNFFAFKHMTTEKVTNRTCEY